jgi:hypothetical protein
MVMVSPIGPRIERASITPDPLHLSHVIVFHFIDLLSPPV